MDSRLKLKEIKGFIHNLYSDYKNINSPISKKDKRKAHCKTIRLTFTYIWNGITAPFIYPIWYLFRTHITNKVYKNTSWQHVQKLIQDNKISEAKSIVKDSGPIYYWLWTYGDLNDPLGNGELPEGVKSNFKTRYYENAIRNARFTINYIDFRTGTILKRLTIIDTRDFNNTHSSEGLGSAPDGISFVWFYDDLNNWTYIYEDNNQNNMFYYGYTGLLKEDKNNGRFEIGYRSNNNRKSTIYAS